MSAVQSIRSFNTLQASFDATAVVKAIAERDAAILSLEKSNDMLKMKLKKRDLKIAELEKSVDQYISMCDTFELTAMDELQDQDDSIKALKKESATRISELERENAELREQLNTAK